MRRFWHCKTCLPSGFEIRYSIQKLTREKFRRRYLVRGIPLFSFSSLLLLTKVIVSRFFCACKFAWQCLHAFLAKVVQQNILTICVIKVEDAVVSGAKLPYVIFQIFYDLFISASAQIRLHCPRQQSRPRLD